MLFIKLKKQFYFLQINAPIRKSFSLSLSSTVNPLFSSGKKYKRVGIVAGKNGDKILAPLQYDGTMDSILFETWFTEMLLPSLPTGSAIVMDNAAFHRKKQLIFHAQNAGCELIFLPPYSPELNPIENFWSVLKRQLKKTLPNFYSFDEALFDCL